MNANLRYDIITWGETPDTEDEQIASGLIQPFKKIDGILEGVAPVTNVGVFSYRMKDGSMRRELRTPSEVFKKESLDSLRNIHLTLQHPNGLVDQENEKTVSVGKTGMDIKHDAYRIYAPLKIERQDALDAAKKGIRALSCGYTADVEMKPGVWMGVPYDAVQKNIKYNHVAIVDKGRAGDDAKMVGHFDSVGIYDGNESMKTQKEIDDELALDKEIEQLLKESADIEAADNQKPREDDSMKTVKIDGVDYEAEAKVIETLVAEQNRADAAELELKASKEKLDSLQGEHDQMKSKMDEMEVSLQGSVKADAIDGLVAEKIALISIAAKAGVEIKADMSDLDIKKSVILKATPKADLAEKSEVYINARFDAACESFGSVDVISQKQGSTIVDVPKEDAATSTPENARAKYTQNLQDAWKR